MDGKRLCPFVFMLEVVMDRRKRWIHAFVLCAIGIGIAGLQCGLVTRNYTLETEKLKEGQGMRLLMLSDLHSCIYGENQCQLMERIIREQPDCILLCGDIVDDKIPRDGAEQLLQQITQIAPCYYVSGNHEFWSGQAEDIFDMIEQYGVHVLRNDQETVTINEVSFILCGVDDPASTGTRQAHTENRKNIDVLYHSSKIWTKSSFVCCWRIDLNISQSMQSIRLTWYCADMRMAVNGASHICSTV